GSGIPRGREEGRDPAALSCLGRLQGLPRQEHGRPRGDLEGLAVAVTAGPSRRTVEFVFAAALIAIAGAVFVLSADCPAESAAFPRVLAVLLALCAVLVAARQLRHRDEAGAQPFFLHLPRFLIPLVALVAYVVAIDVTGYLLPSF